MAPRTSPPRRTPVTPPEIGPPIPLGRNLQLPGRGRTFLRETGPVGGVPVVLLHGWIASGGLNWFQAFDSLDDTYRVVAPDLRGHGRGLRSRRRFRLADCADDVAAILDDLGLGPAIIVGYSMGGPVAQLIWKRHPHHVRGLVFAATSSAFTPGMRERFIMTTVMASAAGGTRLGQQLARGPVRQVMRWMPTSEETARPASLGAWAAAEMRRHNPRTLLEAGQAIGNYNARSWVGDIDVPTACLITANDRAIEAREQARLAFAINGATIHRIEDGHVVCAKASFGPAVRAAVDDVASR